MGRRIWWLTLMAVVMMGCAVAGAAPQVIHATGVYIMGDNDSPKIAKDAARQEAMRSAVEQAGVYVESYSRTQNMELTEDDVRMISGAVIKVTKEHATPELTGNVLKYTVNLTAEVDPDTIDLKAMMQKRQEMERLQKERDELKRQNEELLEKYERASGREKQEIGHRLESQYALGKIFDECVALIQRGEQHEAISRLTRVIRDKGVADSPLAYAYYLRGRAYYELNSDEYALDDFASAQATPHDDAIYPIWKCHRYRGLIYYDRRRYQDSYYELKKAWDASPQDDKELWEELQRAERKANQREPEKGKDEIANTWEKVISDILIGAIKKGGLGLQERQSTPRRPEVYRGTPRPRIPV